MISDEPKHPDTDRVREADDYELDPAIAAEVATWPPLTTHQRAVIAAAFRAHPVVIRRKPQ